jgi:ABC-2 type transport system ATP-binding protein
MIKAEALTRTYGHVRAADGVCFEIGPGEIVGLLGHNGAGKTTIMKMLTGCLEPTSGNVTMNGIDVWFNRSILQKQIGYVPENCPLYTDMTVLDYLDYSAGLKDIPNDKKLEQIGYALEKTNLVIKAEKPINTLSRGYRQRLGVAQAILNSPKILILDEPTNGLDPSQILEMRALIKELAKTATVIVSTHILQEVQAVCSRVIIINTGKVALDANMHDLQMSGRLLVSSDCTPEKFAEILTKVPNVTIISHETTELKVNYTLAVPSHESLQSAALLARLLIENQHNIYAIQPVVRDLESIFAEITAKGSISPQTGSLNAQPPLPSEAHEEIVPPQSKQELTMSASKQEGGSNE